MICIAILGGKGFIGKNLVQMLSNKHGYNVTSFDHTVFGEEDMLPSVHYVVGDFFDNQSLENIVMENDVIIHTVCTINPGNSNKYYINAYKNDFSQSLYLCELCTKYRKRLVFISSGGAIYGKSSHLPIPEETVTKPLNHYGNLKLCIENTYRTFSMQQGTDILIARVSNVYGPGQDYSKGVGFVDAVIKSGLTGTDINIYGDGHIIRDYIYIEDACRMLISLLDCNSSENTFNISSNFGTSQNDIVDIVSKHIPNLRVNYTKSRSVDVDKVILDNSRVMQIYADKILTIEEGIEKYIEYLKGNLT